MCTSLQLSWITQSGLAIFQICWGSCGTALQIRTGQQLTTGNLQLLSTHILACNDHCDRWLFQEIFIYYYYHYCYYYYYHFLEIILNDLEPIFLKFNHFYKTHMTSFSFYLFNFYSLFHNYSLY